MPYVIQERRINLDKIVSEMWAANVKADGSLNYILFALCKRTVEPGYKNYRDFLGEINEAAEEIRRRLLVPYEEEKRRINGDI